MVLCSASPPSYSPRRSSCTTEAAHKQPQKSTRLSNLAHSDLELALYLLPHLISPFFSTDHFLFTHRLDNPQPAQATSSRLVEQLPLLHLTPDSTRTLVATNRRPPEGTLQAAFGSHHPLPPLHMATSAFDLSGFALGLPQLSPNHHSQRSPSHSPSPAPQGQIRHGVCKFFNCRYQERVGEQRWS